MGMYDLDAVQATTFRPDSDDDGLPDIWEIGYVLNPRSPTGIDGATGDPDQDSLTNAEEYAAVADPTKVDTDGDDLPDRWEVDHGLDPHNATAADGATGDPDGDGYSNADEYATGTNPMNRDSHPYRVLLPLITR